MLLECNMISYSSTILYEYSIPQDNTKLNPNYQDGMAQRITELTTAGHKLEMSSPWVGRIEEYARNARVVNGDEWSHVRLDER